MCSGVFKTRSIPFIASTLSPMRNPAASVAGSKTLLTTRLFSYPAPISNSAPNRAFGATNNSHMKPIAGLEVSETSLTSSREFKMRTAFAPASLAAATRYRFISSFDSRGFSQSTYSATGTTAIVGRVPSNTTTSFSETGPAHLSFLILLNRKIGLNTVFTGTTTSASCRWADTCTIWPIFHFDDISSNLPES